MNNTSVNIIKGINRKLTEGEVVSGSEMFDVANEAWGENYSQDIISAELIANYIAERVQDEDAVDIDVYNGVVEAVYSFAKEKEAEIEKLINDKLKETNNCRPAK